MTQEGQMGETCTSRARIVGTSVHEGVVVQCDGPPHEPGYHAGPVPRSHPGDRYAWTNDQALPTECGTEVGGHHADPHTCALRWSSDEPADGQGHDETCRHEGDLPPLEHPGYDRLLSSLGFGTQQADPFQVMLANIARAQEVHRALLEAASGHRAAAEAAGFSPTMAEQMAVTFYLQAATGTTPGMS